ncbi:MAG: tetratricopeptide repeat protein [Bacteroidales bacterium]
MKTNDFSYFIERFNAGEMNEAEKQWFLKEIEGNESLSNEVSLRKRTDEILKNQKVMSLRNKLSEIERQRNKVMKPVIDSKKTTYAKYAAVFAGLILIGSITMFSGKTLNSEKIMKRYYKVYEPPTSQRSAQSGTDADFTQALEFYNTHEYDKAAILFNRVLENKPNDMQTILLRGVSNFEEKRYPEAKQSFVKVIDNKDNMYIDQAQWYLALCYLNTNDTEKAKQLFEIIGKEDGIYKSDAKKIIRGLK